MGIQDIEKHGKTQGQQQQAKHQTVLHFHSSPKEVTKRAEAELKMAVLATACNIRIPLAFHDHHS